jgi:histidine decarboxylase
MVGNVGNGLADLADKPEPLPEELNPEKIVDPLASATELNGYGEKEIENNGIEKKKREIVLGRNVRTMCFSIVEPEADDELTGDREAYMASVLARYRRSLVERTKHHLGICLFPLTCRFI